MKIMGFLRADAESEAGAPPSADLMQRMGVFVEEAINAGVILATDDLHPSVRGKRVKLATGKVTVTDGPFTESKELISSYAVFQVDSMDEAVKWTTRFLQVLGRGECELRPIFEASDFSSDVFSPEQAAAEEKVREKMKANGKR
jgi:hypothetical protein